MVAYIVTLIVQRVVQLVVQDSVMSDRQTGV